MKIEITSSVFDSECRKWEGFPKGFTFTSETGEVIRLPFEWDLVFTLRTGPENRRRRGFRIVFWPRLRTNKVSWYNDWPTGAVVAVMSKTETIFRDAEDKILERRPRQLRGL